MKWIDDPIAWLENPGVRRRTILTIWCYDIIRFLMISPLLPAYGINPLIFFFLDMVTVPTYVTGWTRLIRSLNRPSCTLTDIIKWSVITFFASTAPYLYAAAAGKQSLPPSAWLVLGLIILFPAVKICSACRDSIRKDNKIAI